MVILCRENFDWEIKHWYSVLSLETHVPTLYNDVREGIIYNFLPLLENKMMKE